MFRHWYNVRSVFGYKSPLPSGNGSLTLVQIISLVVGGNYDVVSPINDGIAYNHPKFFLEYICKHLESFGSFDNLY